MALQLLDLGTPNKGDGTPGRDGGQIINDNFTELYSFVPSAALLVDGSVDGTDQLFTGHVAVGADAAVDANIILNVEENVVASGLDIVYPLSLTTSIETNNVLQNARALGLFAEITGNGTLCQGYGMFMKVSSDSSTTLSSEVGILTEVGTKAGSTQNVDELYSCKLFNAFAGIGAVTKSVGLGVVTVANSKATTAIGLEVGPMSGSTNMSGIQLQTDGPGGDIVFGASQQLSMGHDGTNWAIAGSGVTAVASTATVNATIPIDINGTVYHIMLSTTA